MLCGVSFFVFVLGISGRTVVEGLYGVRFILGMSCVALVLWSSGWIVTRGLKLKSITVVVVEVDCEVDEVEILIEVEIELEVL